MLTRLAPLAPLALLLATPLAAQAADPHVRVDALGYRPLAPKVAVFREPVVGFDAPAPFAPGATVEVRRSNDGSLAFAGPAVPWNGGAVHGQSGDRAWWFDFGALVEEGVFHVIDPASGQRSEDFEIAPDVYRGVLRDAVRVFFLQRSGFAKQPPFVDAAWADGASHLGPEQDLDCRAVGNPVPATSRDLSGGWYDAGDYNKYVNFADDAVHDLLYAYRATPDAWTDDYGLPESGNGVPDLLDEVRWELAWLLRMRSPDGSLLHKVSVTDFSAASPPSADTAPRRYAPATASATVSGAHVFAHAARVWETLPDPASQAFAAQLENAALAAWSWLAANPASFPSAYDNAGFANVAAEDSPYQQQVNRLGAAAHLFALTGDPAYRAVVDGEHQTTHLFQWGWASQWEHDAQDVLLEYARTPGATPAVAESILAEFETQLSGPGHLGAQASDPDAYRAHLEDGDTTWGSNRTKVRRGTLYLLANEKGIDPANAARYAELAEGYLHHLHGVNPLGHCYVSNLAAAPDSVKQIYHAWFGDGTVWDGVAGSNVGPPPGYLVGGANPYFQPDGAYVGPPLVPPQGQPAQKSYRDWNTSWPENSWELSEPAIGYQASYVRLLAAFALERPPLLSLDVPDLVAGVPVTFTTGGATPGALVAILWSHQPGVVDLCLPVWCLRLGITLAPNPLVSLLFLGPADAAGTFSGTAVAPPSAIGADLLFQGTQAGTSPYAKASGVVGARIR